MSIKELLTEEKYIQIVGAQAMPFYEYIIKYCEQYGIDNVLRLAGFLAQVGHESAGFSRTTENLNYSAQGLLTTFPKYFPSEEVAMRYARNPEAIANRVYANRLGNGPEESGDGWRYRGHGLIQLTGKYNFERCSKSVGRPYVNNPSVVASEEDAVLSSCWFWATNSLNDAADAKDIETMTRRINGGRHGIEDRRRRYSTALFVLSDGSEEMSEVERENFVDSINPTNTYPSFYTQTPGSEKERITEGRSTRGQYPYNAVYVTRSGHVVEYDDTPNNERINVLHRTGSYAETVADGTYTNKSIKDKYDLTNGDWYGHVGGTSTLSVLGQAFWKFTGVIFKSLGSFFIEAATKIQLNAPHVSFSDLLTGKTSEIESGHFVNLSVDNVIDGTAEFANYINYRGRNGRFNFRAFADSVEVSEEQIPTWTTPTNHTQGTMLGGNLINAVRDDVSGSVSLMYFNTETEQWQPLLGGLGGGMGNS